MLSIAIYGNSVALSSLGASLRENHDLVVAVVDTALPGAVERVTALNPDAVIFDLPSTKSEILDLWKHHPNLLLIGVDVPNQRARVLSAEASYVATPDDLVRIIEAHVRGEKRE
jgi:CheY-like chemotaxis protein